MAVRTIALSTVTVFNSCYCRGVSLNINMLPQLCRSELLDLDEPSEQGRYRLSHLPKPTRCNLGDVQPCQSTERAGAVASGIPCLHRQYI